MPPPGDTIKPRTNGRGAWFPLARSWPARLVAAALVAATTWVLFGGDVRLLLDSRRPVARVVRPSTTARLRQA